MRKILEKDIQRQICEVLKARGVFFWRSNNVPVFARSNDGVMRFRALPKFTPRGLPDIMILCGGKFIGVEVKRYGGKIRPEQAVFGAGLVAHGGSYYILTSADEVDRITELQCEENRN